MVSAVSLAFDISIIGVPYDFYSSSIDFNVVAFFNFKTRDWDHQKIKDYMNSLVPVNNENRIIDINKNNPIIINNHREKLPVFEYNLFYKDLRYFNKLNEIRRNFNIKRKNVIKFF